MTHSSRSALPAVGAVRFVHEDLVDGFYLDVYGGEKLHERTRFGRLEDRRLVQDRLINELRKGGFRDGRGIKK